MLRDFEKYKINPPKGLFKSVEFVFTNPTSSDVSINIFDSDAPALPSTPFVLPTSVLTTIPVGTSLSSIAYNPFSDTMYVCDFATSAVSVIDCATNIVVGAPIPVGASPSSIAYNSLTNTMYVVNQVASTVSVIDCATNTVIGFPIPIGVALSPRFIAYNSINDRMYVCNNASSDVYVIDCGTNTILGVPIPVGTNPRCLAFSSVQNAMYVTNFTSNDVSVINCVTNTVVGAPISVGTSPQRLAYNSLDNTMYVTNSGSGDIYIIDCSTNLVLTFVAVVTNIQAIAYNVANNFMYICNFNTKKVIPFDCSTNAVGANIGVGIVPRGIAYNNLSNSMYVANFGDGTVSFIGGGLQFYTSALFNQFTSDSTNNPKQIRQIWLRATSQLQLFQTLALLDSDANGQQYTYSKDPNNNFSADQFQSLVTVVNFDSEEFIVFASTTVISNYIVKANSSITMLFFYKEIKRIDMLYGKNISILEQMVNEISPDAGDVSAEEIDFNAQDQYYVRPDWSKDFSDTKIASEMVAKQLLEMKELKNKVNNINTL